MAFDEYVAFLEPNNERGGALCQSSEDWNKQKTALEEACRELGPRCRYEIRQVLESMRRVPQSVR